MGERTYMGERATPEKHRGIIELRVRSLDDLFHAFDPSPMVGRDLDNEVEAYILESALELPERAYRLVIHVTAPAADTVGNKIIAAAVRSYFAYRSEVQARRLRLLLREGRQALAVGLGFLALCWGLGFLAVDLVPAPFGDFLNEGLLIIGWVANWRPAEIFLYDWRPMKRQGAVLDALAEMDVHFRIDHQDSLASQSPDTGQADKTRIEVPAGRAKS